ncbi:MAG: homoserine kinase [Pelolinea sp.]|nr:homoserine kinase [Pelolinea sp.]
MVDTIFTVHLPATTANLGPGFDCLGLALDLLNTITFSLDNDPKTVTVDGEGKGILPENEENLIFLATNRLAGSHGSSLPEGLHIHCQNNIPIASGLGSSACAVIGGLVGARKLLGLDISDQELLQTAAQIEGHADNAAACLFGGLILVGNEKGIFNTTHLEMEPLTAIVAVPEFSFSTEAARKALPVVVPLSDAVLNIKRTVELVQILGKGKYEHLKTAMYDNLHQVYRLPLLPGAEEAMRAAIAAGAYGTCLSGAGPSVIAFSNRENAQGIGKAMLTAYEEVSLSSQFFLLACPAKGYFVT